LTDVLRSYRARHTELDPGEPDRNGSSLPTGVPLSVVAFAQFFDASPVSLAGAAEIEPEPSAALPASTRHGLRCLVCDISRVSQCIALQHGITGVLRLLAVDLRANLSGMVPALWRTLMAQLTVAPLALRRATLQVALALLDISSDVVFVAPVALAPIAGLLALAHDVRLCAHERPRDVDDMIGRVLGTMLKLRADMRSFAANLVDVPANLRASTSDELKCALLRLFAQQLARNEVGVTSLAHLLLPFVRPRDFAAQLPQTAVEHFVECLRVAVARQRNVADVGASDASASTTSLLSSQAVSSQQAVVAMRKPAVESSQSKRRRLANDASSQQTAAVAAAAAMGVVDSAAAAASTTVAAGLPHVDDDIELLVREAPRGDVMATLVRLASERSHDASEIVAHSVAIDVLARVALALVHRHPHVAVLQRAARGALVLVQRFGGDLLGTREWHRASEFGVALSRYASLGRWLLTEARNGALDEQCVRDVGDAFLRVAIDAFGVVSKGASPMLQRGAYDVELRCHALWCIALLPAAFELPRRVQAMTLALRESSNNVRALALSLLPLVLVAHGGAGAALSAVDALRQFAEPLVRLAREAPPEVQLALAGVASTLACAASDGGDAARRVDVSAHGFFQLECCAVCRRDLRSSTARSASAAAAATTTTSATVRRDSAHWQWFVDLFAELRGSASKGGMPSLCAWLATLPRLVLHMPAHVDTVAMLFEYVAYLTDDRDSVRRAAINAFAWIVGSESFARQPAAIARLREAFDEIDSVEKQCSLIELFGTLSHSVRRQALFDVLSLLALESVDAAVPARLRAAARNELQKLHQWLVSSGSSLVTRLGATAHAEFQYRLLRRFLVEHESKDTLEDVWPNLYPDAAQRDVQQPFRELLLLFSQASSATLPMTPLLGAVFPLIIAREDTELFGALKEYSGKEDTALLLNFVPGIFAAVYTSPLFPDAAAVSKAKRFIVDQFGCSLSALAAVAENPTLNALLVRLGGRVRRVHLRACQALHVLRRIMQRFRKQQEALAAAAQHQRSGSAAAILTIDDDIENYTDDVPPDLPATVGGSDGGSDRADDGGDAGDEVDFDEQGDAINASAAENELLASFLQLHFLSFMDFVAQRIAVPSAAAAAVASSALVMGADVGEQLEVLRSVQKLLPLLRDHINALSPKILTTLNLAMKQEALRGRACSLWHTFIRCSSDAQLGHNLSRIFVDLLPHVEPVKGQVNEAVVSIMRALVIDPRRAIELRQYFRNIPVLADSVPADIRSAIAAASNAVDCATRLCQLAAGVLHESVDVRSCSLEALARLLREQQAYIQSKLVLPAQVPDKSVLTVVAALLRRCRDASASQRPQLAECLGLLGAIDPARIGDIALNESDTSDLDRTKLSLALVNQFLVGELCAARNRVTQDRVSFAIQELMRVLECTGAPIDVIEATENESRLSKSEQAVKATWALLNESARAVVRPYLTSNYELLDGVEKRGAVELPIYRPGRDRFWLLLWCQHLLSKVSGAMAAVFAACRGVLKDSTAVASFVLPHMVLNALQHGGDETVREISNELLAVLNTTASLYTPLRTPSQRGGGGGFHHHAPPTNNNGGAASAGFAAPHGGQMNVQRVFALYDWLSQWCAQAVAGRKRSSATRSARGPETNVVMLLELMPHRLLARGAAIARAWPRALRHIETHIREQWEAREQAELEEQLAATGAVSTPSRGGGGATGAARAFSRVVLQSKEDLDEDIAFMYKIYSELDEPDGLAGVATLRPQVEREQAAEFVNAGRWQEALATYDAMLQQNPRSITNRRGLLDTLSVTTLYHSLVTHVQAELPGLSCDDPSAPGLLSLGVEAAWRTSSWPLLERFLSHSVLATDALQQPSFALMPPQPPPPPSLPSMQALDDSTTAGAGDKRRGDGAGVAQAAAASAAASAVSTSVNFNVAVGRLLMALRARQRERFDAVLRVARIDEMRALSVASMESYERSYPHLVRLHMLTELEQTWSVVGNAPSEHARVAPLESWSRRLQLTRPQFQTRQSLLWLRKALFELHGLDVQAQRSWLAIARAARHAGHHLAAQSALTHLSLSATANSDGATAQRVAMERAMLLWSQGSHHAAVTTLRTLLVSMNELSARRMAAAALGSGGDMARLQQQQQQQQQQHYMLDLCLADDDDGRIGLGTGRALDGSEGGGEVGDDRVQRAETLLLLGEWMEKTGEGEHRDITQMYDEALSIAGDYERSHFRAASYWNSLVIATETRDLHLSLQSDSRVPADRSALLARLLTYAHSAIDHFGKSLLCGSAHVHESLSRLLTLWLDKYGYFMCQTAARKSLPLADQKVLRAIEKNIGEFLSALPAYYFYECRAQIISRLRHQCEAIAAQLAEIVTRVLMRYPDRAIWALISALNSSDKARQTIAESIVASAVRLSGGAPVARASGKQSSKRASIAAVENRVEGAVRQTRQLVAQLIALCDHTLADDVRDIKLRSANLPFGSALVRATHDGTLVVLPNLSALTVQLPSDNAFRADDDAEVQPFDATAPCCVEMLDDIVVFNSLQKPRRVVVRASDGRQYKFLCKKDDDLRKDARVIEFELLIGRLLSADAEARRRGLSVRTYSVVPLSETSGILEWVDNTVPVRGALVDLYQERRQWNSKNSIKLYEQARGVINRVAMFEKLVKSHPPALHRWFVNQFADASVWLRARLRYSRSLAVMSMVGFVLGLGDRHLENILIDDKSGEVVFIDLNCIFLKAETFHYPEHVPFRLTQNLRDGMGVTQQEGVFRSVATITLRVLRNHRTMLMTVLETLIYDPLVDWKRHKPGAGEPAPETEKRPASEEAEKDLHTVELKLLGQPHPSKVGTAKKSSSAQWPPIVKSTAGHGLAMTVEAQVDHLIREATDARNLSHMFVGWASWL
jgi:hypothetical protein